MPTPRPKYEGTLAPAIEAFVNRIVATELAPKTLSEPEIQDLLRCPVVKAPLTVITLMGLSFFGDYTHEDEKIQTFIRENISGMRGSFRIAISQMFSAIWAGCAVAEWGIRQEGKQWVLDRILVLPPKYYSFVGTLGGIDLIRYRGTEEIDIAYSQVLHIVNCPHFSFNDPAGCSDLDSAIAAVKAWKILMAEMVVAGQRQATPLTAAFYDDELPETPVFEEDGTPKVDLNGDQVTQSPQAQMAEQVEALENRTVLVTSTKNRVEAISTNAEVSFFTEALRICHKLIFLSFLFPETGLEAIGTSGDSNLNKGHMALLRRNVEQIADQLKEGLLETVIRPLIEWNFGPQKSYGQIPTPTEKDDQRIELFNALSSAVSQQIFAVDDLAVINKLYELAGLPQVEEIKPSEPNSANFGVGITDKDFSYWKVFETNGQNKN